MNNEFFLLSFILIFLIVGILRVSLVGAVNINTYDGSNQTVHPSVVYLPDSVSGYNYWMANTPFPYEDANKENPSIFVCQNNCLSDFGVWFPPRGLINPINKTRGLTYHSDPDLVYDNAGVFYIYYRKWDLPTQMIYLYRQNSTDGINWGDEVFVFSENKSQHDICRSNSILIVNKIYQMWCQNTYSSTGVFFYNSTDGLNWTLYNTSTNPTKFVVPIWHFDVGYIKEFNEYWMIYATSTNSDLYFADSTDGLNWTVHPYKIVKREGSWDSSTLYRPTFLFNVSGDDKIHIYSSGKNNRNYWTTGYFSVDYSSFFDYINNPEVSEGSNQNNNSLLYYINSLNDRILLKVEDYLIDSITGVFALAFIVVIVILAITVRRIISKKNNPKFQLQNIVILRKQIKLNGNGKNK